MTLINFDTKNYYMIYFNGRKLESSIIITTYRFIFLWGCCKFKSQLNSRRFFSYRLKCQIFL